MYAGGERLARQEIVRRVVGVLIVGAAVLDFGHLAADALACESGYGGLSRIVLGQQQMELLRFVASQISTASSR